MALLSRIKARLLSPITSYLSFETISANAQTKKDRPADARLGLIDKAKWHLVIPAVHKAGHENLAHKLTDRWFPEYHGYLIADY